MNRPVVITASLDATRQPYAISMHQRCVIADVGRMGSEAPAIPTMREIAHRVAERNGVTVEDLRGPSRRRIHAWPRQEAMWLMHRVLTTKGTRRFSLPQIGYFLGDRNHATVIHGIRCHEARMKAGAE